MSQLPRDFGLQIYKIKTLKKKKKKLSINNLNFEIISLIQNYAIQAVLS